MIQPVDLALVNRQSPIDELPPQIVKQLQGLRVVAMDVDGVLTDGKRLYAEDGHVGLMFDARDGLGIELIMHAGVRVMWISALDNSIIHARARDLSVTDLYLGARDKGAIIRKEMDRPLAFIGDDIWDLGAFQEAELAIAVQDAHASVLASAHLITRSSGGRGAIREVADLVLQAKHLDPRDLIDRVT